MKKHLLYSGTIFIGILSIQAQFTIADDHGTPINDGDIFMFSALGDPDATLSFNITNTSSGIIDMRFEYVSLTNGDDLGDNICIFGACTPPPNTTVGDILPLSGSNDNTMLDPGESMGFGDHFYNTDEGDGTNYPVEYVFRFFELNGNGDPISITYKYDGTAAIEDTAQVEYKLFPNVSSDYVKLIVNEAVSAQLISIQGQVIRTYNFEQGHHTIDVSFLSKQLYYLKLKNQQNQYSIGKILVK